MRESKVEEKGVNDVDEADGALLHLLSSIDWGTIHSRLKAALTDCDCLEIEC